MFRTPISEWTHCAFVQLLPQNHVVQSMLVWLKRSAATSSFRSFKHFQNDTLHTAALKLLFVSQHYVSLHFTMPYLTQNWQEIGRHGMTWSRTPTPTKGCKANGRRSIWLEELLCSGVPKMAHNFVSLTFLSYQFVLAQNTFSFLIFHFLFQQRLPLYFPTWFTQHEHVYHIIHHQAICSKQ
jgi:hypothetical protein